MISMRSPGSGLLGICEGNNFADSGNVAELGVMRAGRVGLVADVGDLIFGTSGGITVLSVAVAILSAGDC